MGVHIHAPIHMQAHAMQAAGLMESERFWRSGFMCIFMLPAESFVKPSG
jgi:hypothetical protein